MKAAEMIRRSIQDAKRETDAEVRWSESARSQWVGYVSALSQLGILTSMEWASLLRDDLGVEQPEIEYGVYLQDVNLEAASDLRDLMNLEREGALA